MDLLLRLTAILQNILCKILDPIYWLITKLDTSVPLQSIRKPELTMSATQMAEQIRTGELKSEDAVNAYFFRNKRVNMMLDAVVDERYADALKEAEKVDELIASGTKSEGELKEEMPLLGVPFTVSECCKVKDMSYAMGCTLLAGKKAENDGEVVQLLRKAGAIPLVVSNQPELCLSSETSNLVTGLTKNPYSIHHTVGGSAGGEAALVSSAGSIIGIGSDFLGSVRCPAMFTGIFGHRPTPGCVSSEGHHLEVEGDLLTLGPLLRYAEDLPLIMRVIAGDNASKLKLDQQINIENLKVFYITQIDAVGLPAVDKEIKLAIMKAADYLRTSCSCNTQKAEFKEMSDCLEMRNYVLFNNKNLPDILRVTESTNPKEPINLYKEIVKSIVGLSSFSVAALWHHLMKISHGDVQQDKQSYYDRKKELLKKNINEALGEDGVLLLPTYPTAAHYHHQWLVRGPGHVYCSLATVLGMPATSVPISLNKHGLPIGLQVIAAPYHDRLCFAVAQELERAFGGWVQPPCLQTPTEG